MNKNPTYTVPQSPNPDDPTYLCPNPQTLTLPTCARRRRFCQEYEGRDPQQVSATCSLPPSPPQPLLPQQQHAAAQQPPHLLDPPCKPAQSDSTSEDGDLLLHLHPSQCHKYI